MTDLLSDACLVLIGLYFGFMAGRIMEKRKNKKKKLSTIEQPEEKGQRKNADFDMNRVKWDEVAHLIRTIAITFFALWVGIMMIETLL